MTQSGRRGEGDGGRGEGGGVEEEYLRKQRYVLVHRSNPEPQPIDTMRQTHEGSSRLVMDLSALAKVRRSRPCFPPQNCRVEELSKADNLQTAQSCLAPSIRATLIGRSRYSLSG